MKLTTDIAIIGGGVIGCALAYYLGKARIDVVVVERGEIGGQASGVAAGLLAPLGPLSGPGPFADLLLSSFALFPTLVPELEDASGLHLSYERTGALRTVRDAKRIPKLRKRLEAWKALGLEMHWLDGNEARRQEPLLSPEISAAIYVPEESQIQAPELVKAYAVAAARRGARIYEHTEVVGLQQDHDKITAILTMQGQIALNKLIIATGAWTAFCNNWLHLALPVSPLRGQMISYSHKIAPVRYIIFGEAAYLAPKGDSLVVGATKEEAGFDAAVTEEGVSWLQNTATRLVPALQQSHIEARWAGLRPRTPDGKPILGPAPHRENVILATGHNSTGIILSAITAQAITQYVTSGRVPEIIHPFSLRRFSSY
ncbi:MAG TPA: glycine oxidase ThiO [Ktedonobacteraceae bacterium]|nr:glycine oxidase ThiO [Ktedonobacteraceae bacterium]